MSLLLVGGVPADLHHLRRRGDERGRAGAFGDRVCDLCDVGDRLGVAVQESVSWVSANLTQMRPAKKSNPKVCSLAGHRRHLWMPNARHQIQKRRGSTPPFFIYNCGLTHFRFRGETASRQRLGTGRCALC